MPYRDEKEALRARIEDLDKNLSSIDEKSRELSALREGESELRKERDALRRKLRELDGPRKLPTLANLGVASPCHEKWDDMVGDDTSRFCLKCEKNVYDLSSMTKEAAEALIAAKEGSLCARFYRRADGTVITADCPEGIALKRRRSFAFGVLGASLLAGGGLAASQLFRTQGEVGPRCTRTMGSATVIANPPEEFQGQMVMGDVAEPAPPPPASVHPEPKHTMGKVAVPVANPLPFTPPNEK